MANSTLMTYFENINGTDEAWLKKEIRRLDILLKYPEKLNALSPTALPLLEEARRTIQQKLDDISDAVFCDECGDLIDNGPIGCQSANDGGCKDGGQ